MAYEGPLPWLGGDEVQDDAGREGEDTDVETETKDTATEDDNGLADGLDAWEDDDGDGVSDDEWERRVLCGDESCIGVIGPDGRCKECGKPFKEG